MENFKTERVIGKGSYGEVWLSKHVRDRKQYVLKKMDLRNASKRERKAAEQEAKLLSKLRHPNIVAYKDSFETDGGFLWIAMGYCEGGDLYNILKARKGQLLEERQIVEWFVQISMALQYLHERNILHRDLKTQNIFLTKTRIIKIGDLGIARVLNSSCDMATTLIGTPYYMSPELFSNRPYNHKSDVWALGCCVYEMAVLKHAFNAKDMNSLVYKILRGKMPEMPRQYSKDLTTLIRAMLNQNPAKRPSVNKVLRDPYIRQNIAIFLEGTKKGRRPPSGDARPANRRGSASGGSDHQQEAKDAVKDERDMRKSRDYQRPSSGKQRPSSGKHRPTSGDKRRVPSGDRHQGRGGEQQHRRPFSGGGGGGDDKLHASYDEAVNVKPSSGDRRKNRLRRKEASNSPHGGGDTPRVTVEKHRPLPPTPTDDHMDGQDFDMTDGDPTSNEASDKISSAPTSFGAEDGIRTNPNLSARQRRRNKLNDSGKSVVSVQSGRVSYDEGPLPSGGGQAHASSLDTDDTSSQLGDSDPTLKVSDSARVGSRPVSASSRGGSAGQRSRPESLVFDGDDDAEPTEEVSQEELQRKNEEKEINSLVSYLDATLHMVSHSVDTTAEPDEEDVSGSSSEDTSPVHAGASPAHVTEREGKTASVGGGLAVPAGAQGDAKSSEERPRGFKSPVFFGEATLNSSGRLAERIAHLSKDCLRGVGLQKLSKAKQILDDITADNMESRLLDLLGEELYDEYAGKIWQLKFCEESAFF